jgi:hypothetical protein
MRVGLIARREEAGISAHQRARPNCCSCTCTEGISNSQSLGRWS